MFRYSIVQFLRNLKRRKVISFINITGLGFGIAFMMLIGQYIYHEFNFNTEIKNAENIYRLVNAESNEYYIDYRIKDRILESVPGVKNACVLNHFNIDANTGKKVFKNENILITDPNIFDVFNLQFLYGNSQNALNTINDIVLTESAAKRIFGQTDVIGKMLRLNHQDDMVVTGVVKNLPANLSFNADLFASYLNSPKQRLYYNEWSDKGENKANYVFNIFLELNNHADVKTVEKQISSFHKINDSRYPKKIILTPFKANYLNTEYADSSLMHGNPALIKILSVIGVIILLLAVINFINLETAEYKHRLKEIGVKKSLGAERKNLIHQLLVESFLTCTISAAFGIIIAELLLPYFNQYINEQLSLLIFSNLNFLGLFLIFISILSILTGLFPAIVLSKISPVQLFKSNPHLKGSGKNYRGVLTIFQFSIAIILTCILIIISKQIDYVKHKDLGFKTDKLLYLNVNYTMVHRIKDFADKLIQYNGIKSFTETMGIPGDIRMVMNGYKTMFIDTSTLNTFGFKIIKGRNLFPGDVDKACLVNKEVLKKFGSGNFEKIKINGCSVAGVVADFNYSSLYNSTGPLVLMYSPEMGTTHITIRISGRVGQTIDYIKKSWKKVFPDYAINYGFYDDYFASMYEKEEKLASLISVFSVLAVIISCLGIFGLSVFQSEQRIKEIGIRKVLGASVSEIMLLLTKSFSKWVIFANIIAIPVAYFFMNKWLQYFAYRIELYWWIFALAGSIAFVIALATVSFQTIKAATANPVKSLRYE